MIKKAVIIQFEKYEFSPVILERVRALKHAWLYKDTVLGRNVEVTFASNHSCDAHFAQICIILKGLLPQTTCMNPIRISIFLSDHRKVLPTNGVLGHLQVNTGYARACNEIVVYREEEWRKVFIHECFHFLKFDRINEGIEGIFNVPVHVDLRETFCEVWARIINCIFSPSLDQCLESEKKWACFQMVKVLDYMGLTYMDLLENRCAQYRENTNVFAYIILGAILLHDVRSFMVWSGGFNAPNGMRELIRRHYRTPQFLSQVASAEKLYAKSKLKGGYEATTLRMSVLKEGEP
jgi:hypothetical protein